MSVLLLLALNFTMLELVFILLKKLWQQVSQTFSLIHFAELQTFPDKKAVYGDQQAQTSQFFKNGLRIMLRLIHPK